MASRRNESEEDLPFMVVGSLKEEWEEDLHGDGLVW